MGYKKEVVVGERKVERISGVRYGIGEEVERPMKNGRVGG